MQIRKKAGLRCIAAVFLLFILATGTVLASDLLLAAAAGNLETGANVQARTVTGVTALMLAEDPVIVRMLLDAGADVDLRDFQGKTALSISVFREDPAVLQLLIGAGADVQARTELGKTVLNGAVGPVDDPEIIEALIAAGADVNAKDNVGWTPLLAAAQSTEHPENIELLLAAGADATAKSYEGKTAFDYAQENPALWDTEAFWMLNDARF